MAPKTRYASHGELSLAYQVMGEGSVDMVLVPGFISHVEVFWADPAIKSFLGRLAAFSRLLIFDKAGTGLSDPVSGVPTLEERAAEIEAVMDAAGMERAAIFGLSEGGPAAIFFSLTRPERVESLILFATFVVGSLGERPASVHDAIESFSLDAMRSAATELRLEDDELPEEAQLERGRRFLRALDNWGEGTALRELFPHRWSDAQLGRLERLCASPGMARAAIVSAIRLNVIDLLEAVDVPTLIVHPRDDVMPVQNARLMARRIRGARLLEVDGADHAPWFSSPDEIISEIEQFLTGRRHAPRADRVLATVLFTDIVGSTERAAKLGDTRWRATVERHDELTRRGVAGFDGTAVKNTGDGFLAVFDGPAKAIHCAEAVRDALAGEGIEIRGGLHTGEIEQIGEDIGGLGVHLAARVCDQAGAGEILVSRTIPDLVVGSGLAFEDRGSHDLKGIPGTWQLLAVAPMDSGARAEERRRAQIESGSARANQRPTDRLATAIARRMPGALRTAMRLNPQYRRSFEERKR